MKQLLVFFFNPNTGEDEEAGRFEHMLPARNCANRMADKYQTMAYIRKNGRTVYKVG